MDTISHTSLHSAGTFWDIHSPYCHSTCSAPLCNAVNPKTCLFGVLPWLEGASIKNAFHLFVWLIRQAFREVLHEEQVARQAETQPVWLETFEAEKNQEKRIEQMFLVLVQCPWLKRLSKFHVWYFQITTRSGAAGVQPKLIEESSLFCEQPRKTGNWRRKKNIFGQTCQLLLSDLTN